MKAYKTDEEKIYINDIKYLWLEITNKCNLQCIHCYTDSSPKSELTGNMATEDWLKIINEAADHGCEDLQLIGGEPMLHPDFKEIAAFASKKIKSVEVFTNSTLLNDATVNFIHENNIKIATSFYSNNEAIHSEITNNKSSYTNTLKNIRKLINKGIFVRVGLIAMDNIGDQQIDKTIEMLKEIGIEEIRIDKIRNVGRGKAGETMGCSEANELDALCGSCWKGTLAVTYNGEMYPCIMSRSLSVGNYHEIKNLKDVVKGEKLSNTRQKIKKHHEGNVIKANCTPWTDCQPKGACAPVDPCTPSCVPSCLPLR